MKLKRITAAMMALATAFSMTACAGNNDESGADKSLDKVKEKGKLILGLDDSFLPMGFRDDSGNIVGFDIDVATEVASRLGVTLELQPVVWETKESELNSGTIDCIWNGLSIDPERAEIMNLSKPYLKNKMVYVVLDESEIKTIADMAGKKIGVQNGSTAQTALEASDEGKAAGEIVGFSENVTGFMDLDGKGIDVICIDSVYAEYYMTANNKPYRILDGSLVEEEYAVGFRKGDEALKVAVENALSEMKKDGKLGEISTKWFGSDVTIVE